MYQIAFIHNVSSVQANEQTFIDHLLLNPKIVGVNTTSSSNSTDIQNALATSDIVVVGPDTNVPVFSYELEGQPVLALNPYRSRSELKLGTSFTNISSGVNGDIITPSHPVAAGYTGTQAYRSSAQSWVGITKSTLGAGVVNIMEDSTTTTSVVVAAVPKGGTLADETASPNARVCVAFPVGGELGDATSMIEDMIDAAIDFLEVELIPAAPAFGTPGYNVPTTLFENVEYDLTVNMDNSGNPDPTYTSSNLPAGASIDANTGTVSLAALSAGAYSFDVTATNTEGSSQTTVNFTVTVPPVVKYKHDDAMAYYTYQFSDCGLDASGYDRDAVVTGTVTRQTVGGEQNAATFGGTSGDYLDLGAYLSTYATGTEFSFSTSVYNTGVGVQILMSAWNDQVDDDFTVYLNGNNVVYQNRGASTQWQQTSSSTVPTNAWTMITITSGPSGWKLWTNNTLRLSGPETASIGYIFPGGDVTNSSWRVGNWGGTSQFPLAGSLRDTIFINKEIDQDTVDDMYLNNCYGRDVISIKGQSNAVGRPQIEPGIDDDYSLVTGLVDQWRFGGQDLQPATNPLDHQDDQVGDTGFWMGTLRAMVNKLGYKRKFLLVPAAFGNTGFTGNQWNPGDTVYENSKSSVNSAMGVSDLISNRGQVWILGENDANAGMSAAAFQAAFNATLADQVTNEVGYETDTPTMFVQIKGPLDNTVDRDEINTGIVALAGESATRFTLDTSARSLYDNFHFPPNELRGIGNDIANVMFGDSFDNVCVLSGPQGTQSGAYQIGITTSEDITGLVPADFSVNNGTISNITGSGSSWSATVTPDSGSGSNTIYLLAGSVEDNYEALNPQSNTLVVSYSSGGGPVGDESYYTQLIGLGYSGTLGQMQRDYLIDQGYTGDHNQAIYLYLLSLGYTGNTTSELLQKKAYAEGFSTVGHMMKVQGIIPA